MSNTTAKVRLTVDVGYELEGQSPQEMTAMLERMCTRAIGNGMLTGNTLATVDQYSVEVTLLTNTVAPSDVRIIVLRSDDVHGRDTLVSYPETMTKAQASAFVSQAVGDAKRLFPEEHTFKDLVEALESYGLSVVNCPDADVFW